MPLIPLIFGLSACGEGGEGSACSGRAAQCARVVDQTYLPADEDHPARFAVDIRNECQERVDVKLCFEDTRSGADCRVRTAVPSGNTIREEKEERFLGKGLKLFLRPSAEDRQCTFPVNERVRF